MSKTSQRIATAFSNGKREGLDCLKEGFNKKQMELVKFNMNPHTKHGINKYFRKAWNQGFNVGATKKPKK